MVNMDAVLDNLGQREWLESILDLWNAQLNRSLDHAPMPETPKASPSDVYMVIREAQLAGITDLPPMLALWASDPGVVRSGKSARDLANWFMDKGLVYIPQQAKWAPVILPTLKLDFVKEARDSLLRTYPLTIEIPESTGARPVPKSPLLEIHTIKGLLEYIDQCPDVLREITDEDLAFYGIKGPDVMKLRTIFAIPEEDGRHVAMKRFIETRDTVPMAGGSLEQGPPDCLLELLF
jgi:hypothetical protein